MLSAIGKPTLRRTMRWLRQHHDMVMRMALGLVFLWFGLLKFCPGLCDVEVLAEKTLVLMTFGVVPGSVCIHALAVWECAMGATLLLVRPQTRTGALLLRGCSVSLLLHLAGTFLPLLLFPAETWKHFPYAPTLTGQYILKNCVLIAVALSVLARVRVPRARLPTNVLMWPSSAAVSRSGRTGVAR